ncbi:uncharacterized protein EI90DRAFT_3144467 [Cantharellus anzutake]|uniref:uncharacterized protein n=1 Tax=Cantharellus anzutake TaxID=1750568 RepID=UPI00190801AA|nr:uncharacterized protein EI90DRAFT_3144467 [Cantharellus anzutake]KAF8337396.1 hypothetical protein EI90DRAFT_3144467 [Cantharellus anzutake]
MPNNRDMSASFAREVQYTPPPDRPMVASSSRANWFPSHGSRMGESSYQAGGIPTFGDSYGGGGDEEHGPSGINEWETRFGWRVDFEAAVAYLLGPISALALLILETKNDFVRFHAYQSGIFSTGVLILQFILHFIFPRWLMIILYVWLAVCLLALAARAFHDANTGNIGQGGLVRYHLPRLGDIAERWVGEE